jgi:hypothetical protein
MSTFASGQMTRVSLWGTFFLITPLGILGLLFGELKFVWLLLFSILTIDTLMIKEVTRKGSLRTKTLFFFIVHILLSIGFYSINPSFILASAIVCWLWIFLVYEEILNKIELNKA